VSSNLDMRTPAIIRAIKGSSVFRRHTITDAPSPVHRLPNLDHDRPRFLTSFKACVSCSGDGYPILKLPAC
jgi:hypothetical protein